jgi:hypothetical protein
VSLNIDRDRRQSGMEVTDGEDRHIHAMRIQRSHYLGDSGIRNGFAKDRPASLMIGVSHTPRPTVSPGEEARGADVTDQPRDPDRRLTGRFQRCVGKVEETRFRTQDLAGAMPLLHSPPGDFVPLDRSEGLGHLAAGEPDDDHAAAARPLGEDRSGRPDLIIGVGEAHQQCLLRQVSASARVCRVREPQPMVRRVDLSRQGLSGSRGARDIPVGVRSDGRRRWPGLCNREIPEVQPRLLGRLSPRATGSPQCQHSGL